MGRMLSARLAGAVLLFLIGLVPQGLDAQEDARMLTRAAEILGMQPVRINLDEAATERYAVVIGNGRYQHAPGLPNAVADAKLVASILRQSGYVVHEYIDLDKRGFEAALRRILFDTSKGSEVVLYYSGHGVQVGNSNRLIPVDAQIDSIYDLPFESVSLGSLLSVAGARARSLVMILDSCRNNPFPEQGAIVGLDAIPQELRSGFAAQETPVNSLLVFSTSPGAVALDGKGNNSPFTQALAEVAAAAPGVPLEDMLQDVRRLVYERTGGQQVPWESSSMVETITLQSELEGLVAYVAPTGGKGGATGEPIDISMPLEPKVSIGPALQSAVSASSVGMTLASIPENGRFELVQDQRVRGLELSEVPAVDMPNLVYASSAPEQAGARMASQQIVDTFEVQSEGSAQLVKLTLEVDPCDFQAGDYLDPEGVGIGRYPNEIDVEAALAACQAAVARAPDEGRFHYQLGRVHLALRDLDAAGIEFTEARSLGHTRAWQALGLLEIARAKAVEGDSGAAGSDMALALLSMGVESGDPYAFHSLGLQLLEHSEDPSLRRQGFELLSRALEFGHTFSMNALGLYFLERDSDHYDAERGIRYLQESASRDDIYGYANMGYILQSGAGSLKPDPAQALEWYLKASEQGHPTAPTAIGRMYVNGEVSGGADLAQAVTWYDLGLSRGDAWGGANAAWVIANRNPAGFGPGDAAVRAAKAAALRNAPAADEAQAVLDSLPAKAIDAGAQILMTELGEPIEADGSFGPASEAAMARLATKFGRDIPADRMERLSVLAAIYWTTNKFRVDLY